MHCNVRPTSPTVQLTEFPPQKPDHCPGHGNFQVGGAGSGAVSPRVKQTSPATSFRGGLSWPDRVSRTSTRNHASPTRASDSHPSSNHTLESKGTYTKGARLYEPEVTVRRKMEEPTRERKREDSYDARNYEVRCLRDLARKGKESVSSHFGTVAVPDSPTLSAAEDNAEGECYLVRNLNTSMSIKSIQTSFLPHDSTLKPRKSAQTIASTVDFQSSRHKTVVNRRSKSQEQIKITKEELKKNLLELIEEVSKTSQRKKIIRDELIKKLFESNGNERVTKENRYYKKREQCHKYASTFCPTVCDYVGDYQELLGQLKHCYGDTQQVLQSEVTPFRISEYQQLDFVLKDWINNLDIKTVNQDSLARRELLNDLEEKIKVVFKNRD
ncbi:hypothetical protein HF086_003923 [Spodoptera exigua]|uniref:Uncharacterized protein n=1 Tax=Spodoptera exigua TaxID=7107 RepID=A0A922MAR8_SPOEX|nr:hypothetical protein HF086_003923 [Spodoptera exigua]